MREIGPMKQVSHSVWKLDQIAIHRVNDINLCLCSLFAYTDAFFFFFVYVLLLL